MTYVQTYNAENRIASIQKLASGTCAAPVLAAKWDFTYDGDGTRTGQSYTPYTDGQPGTVEITRYYFGGAYETTGSTWKKYYSFGGATLMRDASGFKYFLSDHLGSTSVVLDDDGTILEQQRYLPFGQARVMPPYASVTSTDFTYTGQRNLPDTGLMDYKARFYSPYLNQFTQPDTIVPNLYNPQSLNRYSYALNNPIRYNDPTGHLSNCSSISSMGAQALCNRSNRLETVWKNLDAELGLNFSSEPGADQWTEEHKKAARRAAWDVAYQFSATTGGDIAETFRSVYAQGVDFVWCNKCTGMGRTRDDHTIEFAAMHTGTDAFELDVRTAVHELGHLFDRRVCVANNGRPCDHMPGEPNTARSAMASFNSDFISSDHGDYLLNSYWGFAGGFDNWQMGWERGNGSQGEIWADMFLGWTYNRWGEPWQPLSGARSGYMTNTMSYYLTTTFVTP